MTPRGMSARRSVARALAGVRAIAVMSGGPTVLLVLAVAGLIVTMSALVAGEPPPVLALVVVGALVLYLLLVLPWTRSWGATSEEVDAELPGDDLVPRTAFTMTRAVTIDAPVATVWAWLAQIGQDRGGFYSYTWVENLAGCRMPAADRIHSDWQHRVVGEEVPLHPLNGLKIARFDRERAYVFVGGWGFVLAPISHDRTRLIARGRVPRGLSSLAYAAFVELPHFVMERKMLLGVKRRAEQGDPIRSATLRWVSTR